MSPTVQQNDLTGAVAPLLLFGLQCCLGQAHFEDLQPEHFVLEKCSKNIVDEASKQKTHLFGPKANESNPLALVLPTLTHTPKQKSGCYTALPGAS